MSLHQHLTVPVRATSAGLFRFLLAQPSSPWLPVAVYLPLAAAGVLWNLLERRAAPWALVVLPLSGLLLWTLLEYVFHAGGFHWTAPSLRALRASHEEHHADPKDPTHIVTRLGFSGPLALLLLTLSRLVLGSWEWAALLMSGLLVGYLAYELVHFGIHRWRWVLWLMRPVVKHHLYHHHRDATRCFGVTTPLWDWIFRTGRPSYAATRNARS
jgi:sterol desaturase/sphingolipid hydroxylase (fatty acid hydroxylase superfamily)